MSEKPQGGDAAYQYIQNAIMSALADGKEVILSILTGYGFRSEIVYIDGKDLGYNVTEYAVNELYLSNKIEYVELDHNLDAEEIERKRVVLAADSEDVSDE